MADVSKVHVYTAEWNGRWLAATNVSPYLCFEASSKEEVEAEAKRALALFAGVFDQLEDQNREDGEEFAARHTAPEWEQVAA